MAAALVSSLTGNPLPTDMAVFGEVSLSGAIRAVSHSGPRLREAAKLGFGRAAAPGGARRRGVGPRSRRTPMERIADLVALIAAGKPVRTVERQRPEA